MKKTKPLNITKNSSEKKVSLALGSGGQLMRTFLTDRILKRFANPFLAQLGDSAHLPQDIAFTTDSYVVDPVFFPGGDIGTLAINGTVNDLIVSGAEPRYISLALILEEGLSWANLDKILLSIQTSSKKAGIQIVTGDTKVVKQGQGDKIYINTAGVGTIRRKPNLTKVNPGDKIIVTGPLGEHTLAIMLARGDFGLETKVKSDCAPLNYLLPVWDQGVLWMRDITRGGLATVLSECAENLPFSLLIDEEKIPLSRAVKGATELLGIDPLYLACEGRAVLIAPLKQAEKILNEIKQNPLGKKASIIGSIDDKKGRPGETLLQTIAGGLRLLEPLTYELLPRIC